MLIARATGDQRMYHGCASPARWQSLLVSNAYAGRLSNRMHMVCSVRLSHKPSI